MTGWNDLIEDVVRGDWKDPVSGQPAVVQFEAIRIEEDLDGGEADLLAPLRLGKRLAVVSDANTHEAMGRRVAKHLKALATVEEIVLPGDLHCDEAAIAMVQEKTRHADALVAVGSGALSDACKYATFKDGRKYAVFGTAYLRPSLKVAYLQVSESAPEPTATSASAWRVFSCTMAIAASSQWRLPGMTISSTVASPFRCLATRRPIAS